MLWHGVGTTVRRRGDPAMASVYRPGRHTAGRRSAVQGCRQGTPSWQHVNQRKTVVPRKKPRMASRKSNQKSASSEPFDGKSALIIECPAELGAVARREWDRIVPL